MCGIAGWVGAVDADEDVLRRMCDAIGHRGPDEHTAHIEEGRAGIGFRRLSIIDLQSGRQPLFDEAGRSCVTCNGEIYNFREPRAELESRGHAFGTGSDAECIIHPYEEQGPACLDRLRGMFAIGLWDPERDRLLLARDRLGVKPLYYAEVPGGLLYASEPGAILASGLVQAEAGPAALAQYLTLQYVPPPLSGFAQIKTLAPGERLLFEAGRQRIERWWQLDYAPKHEPEDLLGELDELLDEATRLRMIADVPLGAFLCGGIDSSLVEGRCAREVAALYGTEHEEFLVEPDMVPAAAEAVRFAGEPFADSSAIPTYLLSELTKRHVTVALSGDGGDEAFAGYVRHRLASSADRLGPLPPLARRVERPTGGRGARLARGASAMASHDRYAAIVAHFEPSALERLCTPASLDAAGGPRQAWEEVLALPALRGVDRYVALDVVTYLPRDLLVKVDCMSIAHALEVRSPLLDHHVHEWAARRPGRLKLRRGVLKWPLKELARRRGMPDALVDRPKKGFGIPVGEWFRGELRPWLEDVLFDPRTTERGIFHRPEVELLLGDHVASRADHTPRLWNLAMLELWHRSWIDRPVAAR
jgi:asparagine synthase (glutamine-hydrolysing)